MPRTPALLFAVLLVIGSSSALIPMSSADDRSNGKDEDPTKQREKLLLAADTHDAKLAAIELFTSGKPHYDGKHDGFLEMDVLRAPRSTTPQARCALLEAIGLF